MSPRFAQANSPRWSWRRWLALGLVGGLVAAASAVLWLNRTPGLTPSPDPAVDPATIARGAYLARVGNCAGCHTARGGRPFAGGRALPTPFGTVYAGNLTPDPDTGLGRWNADDFWRAMHHGRSRDGRLLAPAFPYTEFTNVSRADSNALYVYLRSLPPVMQATPETGLRFPFRTQAALAIWRALYFRPAAAADLSATERSAEWQRGAYLVRGLGHCAACHAPRDALGATQGADQLPGGAMPMQPWFAPSLAPVAGMPRDQQQQALIDLLRTGMSSRGTASGPMAEVITNSTQHWSDEDLKATAVYLLSLPPQPLRPAPSAPFADGQRERGAALYADRCANCHGEKGEGAPGIYPPLAGNPTVTLLDPANVMQVIRHGGFAPTTLTQARPFGMPPAHLSAQELADVLTYVRQSWGNQAPVVTLLQSMRAP